MTDGKARRKVTKAVVGWPYRYKIVVLLPEDGEESGELYSRCYTKRFIQEGDFASSWSRLTSNGYASLSAAHPDGVHLAVLKPGSRELISGYTSTPVPGKYLSYIRGLRCR